MRAWVTVLLVTGIALAGCAEENRLEQDIEQTGADGGNATADGTANIAPVASLDVDISNGTAPLNVTFTLDGSDEDGDNLTWTFSIGQAVGNQTENLTQVANGTSLPVEVAYNFTAAGNHSAVLAVSDGSNTTTVQSVISVAKAAAPVEQKVVLEGTVESTCGNCYLVGSEACVSWLLQDPGDDCTWMELDPELVGQRFVTESDGDTDLEFRSDCSRTSDSVESFGADGQESGTIPDAGCIVMFDFTTAGTIRVIVG